MAALPNIPESQSENRPKITASSLNTYHCICTDILFATTYTISELPHRSGQGLDNAIILPCPPLPRQAITSSSSYIAPDNAAQTPSAADYTLLISLQPARSQPIVVRREDGFEKRYLLRCGRCKLDVGYQLDESQYSNEGNQRQGEMGRREDVVYILPGGIMSTDEMVQDRGPKDADIDLGLPAS